ncbi:hypothetical protein Tco_0526025 [Tanacetum coccineum]
MSENKDKYHDTVLNLEAKLKKNVDLILKLGNSLQGMFMLGFKAIICNSNISLHVRDTEDTLDEASKSQQKVYEKMNDPIAVVNKQNCWTIDYTQINDLYKDFVPQKELSAEQQYFPSSFIPSDKNSNATPSIPVSMPSDSLLIIELDKIKNCFHRLSELIQKNCKRASIFYTSLEEIQLNDFCQDQLKPIVNELQFYFEFFKTIFQRDIKEMKDVFESTESALCEQEKQNDFLKDLEVSLKHEVKLSVLLNHEYVDNSLHAEIEQVKNKSIKIQEVLQAKIKSLEKHVQRLANVEKGMNAASSDSHDKDSVLANSTKPVKKVAVYVRKNKQTYITSETVISNKENVIDIVVANVLMRKLCLGHNLFSVGQFCDGDLEVAFRSKDMFTCVIREEMFAYSAIVNTNSIYISHSDTAASSHLSNCLRQLRQSHGGKSKKDFHSLKTNSKRSFQTGLQSFAIYAGPMRTFSDTPINSAAQPTQIHEDSPSTSSIIVDEHKAPPIVTKSDEQTSPISLTEADEFNQEDSTQSDGNSQFVSYNPPSCEEIESSITALEPSNVQNFHQVQPSTHI